MKNDRTSIVTDLSKFQLRVDEILNDTNYSYVKDVVKRLKDALYDNRDVPALCAPQLNEPLRLFVVRNGHKDQERFKVMLNPIIVRGTGLHLSREANPTLPGKEFIIPRRDELHVAYQQIDGQPASETFIGAYSEVVQQMIEMLDGITLADYGLDLDDLGGAAAFDRATQKDKVQVLSMYMDQLKTISADLADEIETNPVLNTLNKSIEFNTGILLGNIKPILDEGKSE